MVVAVDQLVVAVHRLVEGHRLLDRLQREGRLHREGDGGEDPQGAQPDPGRREQVGVGPGAAGTEPALAVDELERGHLGRQRGAPPTRAVGAGGDRTGHGLPVDVAEVVQGQAQRVQPVVEHVQRRPGENRHGHRLPVDAPDPGQPVREQQDAVGDRDVGEGVARADHLHPAPLVTGGTDRRHDLVRVGRGDDPGRGGGGQTRPVPPGDGGLGGVERRVHAPRLREASPPVGHTRERDAARRARRPQPTR